MVKIKKEEIKIIFLIIFLISIICCVGYLSELEEYIPPEKITYEINPHELEFLNDLKIFHDFSNNTGNISFRLREQDVSDSSEIFFHLPRIINEKDLKIYKWGEDMIPFEIDNYNISVIGFKNDSSKNNYSRIQMNNIKLIDSKDTSYTIEYKMKIPPSGRFSFEHYNTKLIGYRPSIKLFLGKNFQCYKSCIDNKKGLITYYPNTAKEINLRFDNTQTIQHIFELSAIKDIRTEQGVTLGVLISSLFASLLILKELLELT